MRRLAFLLVLVLGGGNASAETLVIALSTAEVRIASNFTGAEIVVFGAIQRDAATVSRADSYDIAIVMRGPDETVVARRKDRVFGLWLNRGERQFPPLPAFYAVHATRSLAEMAEANVLERQRLGIDRLGFGPASSGSEDGEFREAFLRLKQEEGLYRQEVGGIDPIGADLFKTTFAVPAHVPDGLYTVSVFLFRSGALLASAEERLTMSKTGFEQVMFESSRRAALPYALGVVAVALFVGWLAGVIFRRD